MINVDTSGKKITVHSNKLDIHGSPESFNRDELELVAKELAKDLEKAKSWYEEWRDRAVKHAERGLMDEISRYNG